MRAMRSFSSLVIVAPGDCSPSRSVVSKMMTRSSPAGGWLSLTMTFSVRKQLETSPSHDGPSDVDGVHEGHHLPQFSADLLDQ